VLDEPVVHALHDHRGLEQVAAVLREDLAPARLAHLVAGPADALQARGDRARRLDLDDEVDRAHVDAQLEREVATRPLQLAPLQLVLDLTARSRRQRAVVGLDQLGALGRSVGRRPRPTGRASRGSRLLEASSLSGWRGARPGGGR
jgi:hypothetical protein